MEGSPLISPNGPNSIYCPPPFICEPDGKVTDGSAPLETSDPIGPAPEMVDAPVDVAALLSDDEARTLIQNILGANMSIHPNAIPALIAELNRVVNGQSSNQITDSTENLILADPILEDYLRLRLQNILNNSVGVNSEAVSLPGAIAQDDQEVEVFSPVAARLIAGDVLSPQVLAALNSGELRIKIRFSTNRQGQFDNFRLILQSGNYQETIAEYRDNDDDGEPEITVGYHNDPAATPIGRGIVTYLQRLLRGTTANQYTFEHEGVFDRNTLTAFYSFVSRENLLSANFNSTQMQQVLGHRITEADESLRSLEAAPEVDVTSLATVLAARNRYILAKGEIEARTGITIATDNQDNYQYDLGRLSAEDRTALDNARTAWLNARRDFGGATALNEALTDADLRLRVTQETISELLQVIEFADRYRDRDLNSENLSETDQAFIRSCRNAAERFRPIVLRLLGEINDQDQGLGLLSLRKFQLAMAKLSIAQTRLQRSNTERNRQKLDQAFSRFSQVAYQQLSMYRRWQNMAQGDPQLHARISQNITGITGRIRGLLTEQFPTEYDQQLQQQLSMIDQLVLTEIEGERSTEGLSSRQIRVRYSRASTLSSQILGSGPQREMVLQFLLSSLQRGRLRDLELSLSMMPASGNNGAFASDCHNILINNTMESFGLPGGRETSTFIRGIAANANTSNEALNAQARRIMGPGAEFFSYIEQHNNYANSEVGRAAGATPIEFGEARTLAQNVLNFFKNSEGEYTTPASEMTAILRLLSRTSNDAETANFELSQMLQEKMNEYYSRDFRRLRGASEITLSPRALHELETDFLTSSALDGLVSYNDITSLVSASELPAGSVDGDMFFVSILGVQRIPAAVVPSLGEVPTVDVNNMTGTIFERDSMDFMRTSRLATIRLAMARYGNISDEIRLMLRGEITNRMTGSDLRLANHVFGEGAHFIFRPGGFQLNALETNALSTIARVLEASETETDQNVAPLLRRASGNPNEARFTADERQALLSWLGRTFSINADDNRATRLSSLASQITEHFPTLNETQRRYASSAILRLTTGVTQMSRKRGLSQGDQDSLNELASYLDYGDLLSQVEQTSEVEQLRRTIALHDARLVSENPPEELVSALRRANAILSENNIEHHSFNASEFSTTYSQSIVILRRLHRSLLILSSKYGPQPRPYEGPASLAHHYYETLFEAMTQAIASPNQADMLMPGIANDINFAFNTQIYTAEVNELSGINTRLDELRTSLGVRLEGNDEPNPLINAVRQTQELLPGILVSLAQNIPSHLSTSDSRRPLITEYLRLVSDLNGTNPQTRSEDLDSFETRIRAAARAERNQGKRNSLNRLAEAVRTLQRGLGQRESDPQAFRRVFANSLVIFIRAFNYPENSENDQIRTVRGYISQFLRLEGQLAQASGNPTSFVYSADQLLEQTILLEAQLNNAISAEDNEDRRTVLTSMRDAVRQMTGQLRPLVQTRDEVMPEFSEKVELEIRRQEIMDILGSDRFDRRRFLLLQEHFPDLLSAPGLDDNIASFIASIFAGDDGRINGAEGFTRQTLGQILTDYFDTNNDGEINDQDEDRAINLSSLLPHPGEDAETITVKIALSQFFERLPREGHINLATALPVITLGWFGATHGLFNIVRDVPAFLGGVSDGGTHITYGPVNYQEITEIANSPWQRLGYSITSWLALTSDERPPMNMSSQLYMILAQSQRESIRENLSAALTSADQNGTVDWMNAETTPLSRVNRDSMEMLLEYLRYDLSPYLNNPRLRQRINYLHETNGIPLSYEEIVNLVTSQEARDSFLSSIPDSDFQLMDSYHSDENLRPAARLLESILKIQGEINQMRAVENIELYPMTYFDPIQELRTNWLRYQNNQTAETPRHISTIEHPVAPRAGQPREAVELDFFGLLDHGLPIEALAHDTVNWVALYGPRAVDGTLQELTDDPVAYMSNMFRGAGGFGINFGVFMGRQIEAGFAGMWGGLGEFASAVAAGDRARMLTALEQVMEKSAHTTGAFTVYEMASWIFYTEVKNEIERENYAGAMGKLLAITWFTLRQFTATINVVRYLFNRGMATIHRGRLVIRNTEAAARAYEARMRQAEALYNRSIRGRIGLKLINYSVNPFAVPNAIRRSYRYRSGGLDVQIRDSAVQVQPENIVTEDPSTWRAITRNRVGHRQFLRNINRLWGGPRRLSDFFARSASSGNSFIEGAIRLQRAYENPGRSFDLMFNRGRNLGRINVSGEVLLELVEARQVGDMARFQQLIETHNVRNSAGLGHRYIGTAQNLWAEFEFISPEQITNARANPAETITLRISHRTTLPILGADHLDLSHARATSDFSRFRQLIESYNLNAGQGYSESSIRQLYDAFTGPGEAYAELFVNEAGEIQAPQYNEADIFRARTFLERASQGLGFENTYRFTVPDINPANGEPITDPRTGQPRTRSVLVNGKQLLQILHNNVVQGHSVIRSRPVLTDLYYELFPRSGTGLRARIRDWRSARRWARSIESHISSTVTSQVQGMDVQSYIKGIGRRFLNRGVIGRGIQAGRFTLRLVSNRGRSSAPFEADAFIDSVRSGQLTQLRYRLTIDVPGADGATTSRTVRLTGEQIVDLIRLQASGNPEGRTIISPEVDAILAEQVVREVGETRIRETLGIERPAAPVAEPVVEARARALPEARTSAPPEARAEAGAELLRELGLIEPEAAREAAPERIEVAEETRTARSPEADADAMARMALLAPVSTPTGPITLSLDAIRMSGECLAEGGTRFNLNIVDTASTDIVTAEAVERLRAAGVEEIRLPENVHPEVVREMVVSEEMLRSTGEGRTVAVVDGLGNAEILTPAEAANYRPAQLTNAEVLQHNALTEFRGAIESAGVERLGETSVRDLSFEQLERLSEKSVRDIMRENNLGRSQAEAIRDSARLTVNQYRFNQNLVSLAEGFGVSVNSGNVTNIANMLYQEYAARGEGHRFFNPDRLFEFLGTEEGGRFLESAEGREFAERVAEMETRYRESNGQIGQNPRFRAECGGLLVSLGIFLGAERLADALGIENPIGKTAFVLGLMHAATESAVPLTNGAWMRLMSTQTLREAGRGLIMLGNDLRGISSALLSRTGNTGFSGFRAFWQARFGNAPLVFGRNSLFARGAWHLLSDGAAWGRFFTSVGHFTLISHAYDGATGLAGFEQDSVVRHPITNFIVSGVAMIGIQRLMTTVFVNTMVSRIWTKVLGPIGVAFFVADMIDMAHLYFMDDYNRSVTLEAREADYHGSDPFMDVNIRHMTNATRSWINIMSILRMVMLAADTYRGEDGQADFLSGINSDHFDHDQVRQLLLALNEGEEGAGLREAIRNLQQMDPPDDLTDRATDHNMLRRGVDGADRYFDDQGRFREDMIDAFISEELFGEFHADDEYRAGNNRYGLDFSASMRQMEDMTSAMLANRQMTRISILYQRELTGQPLNITEADRAGGYITEDGQLDHGDNLFMDFATRSASSAFQGTGPQANALQAQIRLQIIRLRLAYLESNDISILRELNVWGDTIDVSAWEQDQDAMQTFIDEMDSADLDPADDRSALIFASYVARLNNMVPEVSFVHDERGNRIINAHHQQNLSAIRAIDEAADRAAAEERGEVYVPYNGPSIGPG